MTDIITLDRIYALSEDVVTREIEGQLLIVPLAAGIGDMEDELYTLNATGRAIWGKLDGARTLAQIAAELADEYAGPAADIERDVLGLISELDRRKMLVLR